MYFILTFHFVDNNIFLLSEHFYVLPRRRFPRSGQPEPIPQCVNDYVRCVILWDMTNPLPYQHIEVTNPLLIQVFWSAAGSTT